MSAQRRIRLGDREIAYTLKRSARRTIGFTVSQDGLAVAAPNLASTRRVEQALQEKSGWILAKLADWEARPAPRPLAFATGERLPWLGGSLVLEIDPTGVRTRVRRAGEQLIVRTDPDLAGELRTRTLAAALQRHYRREGERVMAPKVEHYAAQLDRRVRKVVVRDQKRRWGSCAPDGTIRLNWRLMGFPEDLIDYVCAHEAAHLVEANHSPAYWRVVAGLMPDWRERRRRMREDAGRWVVL